MLFPELAALSGGLSTPGDHYDGSIGVKPPNGPASGDPGTDQMGTIGVISID